MLSNVGGIAYGAVTIGAVLAAESAQRETYPETLGGALVALALYWLARSYDTFTQRRSIRREAWEAHTLFRLIGREGSILTGAAPPLLVLLVFWVAGSALTTAVDAATWTAAATVVVIELVLGLREKLPSREVAAQTLVGTVLGLLVIVLRAVLH